MFKILVTDFTNKVIYEEDCPNMSVAYAIAFAYLSEHELGIRKGQYAENFWSLYHNSNNFIGSLWIESKTWLQESSTL